MTQHAETPTLQASPTRPQYPDQPTGRETTYTPATAEIILARLADGETLTHICKTPGMPARQTVHQWRMKMPAFDDSYLRARAVGMESMSDDVLTIADDDSLDLDEDGKPNSANVQRSRLMVDTRKFLMAKLAPKIYGDRQTVEHTGSVEYSVTLSERERMRRLATFIAQDAASGALIEGTAQDASTSPPDLDHLPASLPDGQATYAPVDKERMTQDDDI